MYNTLIIGELAGHAAPDEAVEVARKLAADHDSVARVSSYRASDDVPSWLIVELDDPQHFLEVSRHLTSVGGPVRSYHEVFRMDRDADGAGRQTSIARHLQTLPEQLLTIYLPCPPGRNAEWNEWYDGHHMPTVLSLAAGLTVGHRYSPLAPVPDDEYLVLYEFDSSASLDAFLTGGTPDRKKNEYWERWGVRNTRRPYTLDFSVPGPSGLSSHQVRPSTHGS